MWMKSDFSSSEAASAKKIFRFEVFLLSGPVSPHFIARHPEPPSRIIDIRGSQTLDALHQAIFHAFDREDQHMYEFQIGGKKPMDRKAKLYGIVFDNDDPEMNSAEATTSAALNMEIESSFFYWFDFGDDWWHEVRLLAVDPLAAGKGRYPRIVERKGDSPPQYVDWEAEEAAFALPESAVADLAGNTTTAVEKQRFEEISSLTKEFCKSHLTEGFAEVCEQLLASAYGSRLPVKRGKAQSWAAALVHAAGMINFLHDPASKPHMKLRDIAQHFGVSVATMENKSRNIRNVVNTFPLDPRFCLSKILADNPLVWLRQINGIFVDFRTQPREMQEAALKAGLIPFIPETPKTPALPEQKNTPQKET
jgi:hypothetical protein